MISYSVADIDVVNGLALKRDAEEVFAVKDPITGNWIVNKYYYDKDTFKLTDEAIKLLRDADQKVQSLTAVIRVAQLAEMAASGRKIILRDPSELGSGLSSTSISSARPLMSSLSQTIAIKCEFFSNSSP